jgi:putative ABC transport system permease protein
LGSIGAAGVVSDFANAWWAVVSVIGAVLMTPWLISRVARVARLLPLPARLALRDADRHRARTAPAIAAVMASVSAVTALGIASSSDAAEPEGSSAQIHPPGTVLLTSDHMDAVVPAIRRNTGVNFTPLSTVKDAYVVVALDDQGGGQGGEVAVADASTLRRWGVDLTSAERDALDSGLLLVDDGVRISGGQATIEMYDEALLEEPTKQRVRATSADLTIGLPHDEVAGAAVLHPRTAKQLGLTVVDRAAIADRPVRDMDIHAVEVAAASADPVSWYIDIEKQPQRSDYFWVYLILAAAGSLAVLIGTFSATGLALADARPDLATLGAVGARPLTRRLVAGSHALILATLGAALGVIVGLTPGIVAAHLLTNGSPGGFILDIPWALFALLLLGLPIVAGLITTIVARSPSPRPVREAL